MSTSRRSSPFDLRDNDAYATWREHKLAQASEQLENQRVDIQDLAAPSDREIQTLREICQRSNWAVFSTSTPLSGREIGLTIFAEHIGLSRIDHNLCAGDTGVSALTTGEGQTDRDYIPYTNRPLSWHTDGYYNTAQQQIHAWILFCAQDASEGGSNSILDHEMLYLRLRDRDPELISALMKKDALTIPANIVDGETIRPQRTGPVFTIGPEGTLHMRYSARARNILWNNSGETLRAVGAIEALLSENGAPIFHYRLKSGEGIVSNNVLHRREGFRDDPQSGKKRLVLRARFFDRIPGTATEAV